MPSEPSDGFKQSISNDSLVSIDHKVGSDAAQPKDVSQLNDNDILLCRLTDETNHYNHKHEDEENISCGWSALRPNFLQKYRTTRWVLFWLCLAGALQGFIVNGCVNVVITTIEKRYKMKSTESGLIAGGYDVGAFLFLAPVSYFGGTRSKPFFIGVGVLVMGLGALVFSSPYFTAGNYEFSDEVENICRNNLNETLNYCSNNFGTKLSNYKWVFFFGQFLHGVGATPLYTLGCTYLDESVPTKQSSLYLGIFYSMSVLGPGLGYVLGGQFLKWLYVDWLYVNPDDIGLSRSSPVWVGGWYVVFIMGFLLSLIISLPVSAFPKELPGTKKIRSEKVSEAHSKNQNTEAVVNKDFGQTAKDLPKSLRILLRNPTFMFLNLAGATEGMLVSALATFLPKIIEQQFSIATSTAAFIVGVVTIPGAGGGTFLGGYIVKRYDLKCAAIIKFCIICAIISIGLTMAFLISCPNISFAGVTDSYPNENALDLSINSNCNANCSCSDYQYDPVCGLNNQMFYSACHAGCQLVHQYGNSKAYSDCKCLKVLNEKTLNGSAMPFEAFRNKCESECKLLPYFLVLIFLCMLFTFLISMPSLTATLRCVADSQKSFALGIQWMGVRILGTIPAPLMFGSLIDLSCILWQKTCDQESGACLMYNNKQMSRNVLSLGILLKVLSFIFFFFAWFLYKSPQHSQHSKQTINAQTQEITLESYSNSSTLEVRQCCPKYNNKNRLTITKL